MLKIRWAFLKSLLIFTLIYIFNLPIIAKINNEINPLSLIFGIILAPIFEIYYLMSIMFFWSVDFMNFAYFILDKLLDVLIDFSYPLQKDTQGQEKKKKKNNQRKQRQQNKTNKHYQTQKKKNTKNKKKKHKKPTKPKKKNTKPTTQTTQQKPKKNKKKKQQNKKTTTKNTKTNKQNKNTH
nr:hypothetical protein [Mycoplasmopsis bovis]